VFLIFFSSSGDYIVLFTLCGDCGALIEDLKISDFFSYDFIFSLFSATKSLLYLFYFLFELNSSYFLFSGVLVRLFSKVLTNSDVSSILDFLSLHVKFASLELICLLLLTLKFLF